MTRLAIRSDAVILKNNHLLTKECQLIGRWVKQGEDSEEICKQKAKEAGLDIKLTKPLHPMIQWGTDEKGERTAIVYLNYLAKLKEKQNGR